MKNLIKNSLIVLLILVITGCNVDVFNNKEINALKEENKRLQLIKMQIETNRTSQLDEHSLIYKSKENLAKIEMQKTIAEINQVKEMEALRLKNMLDKEKLMQEQLHAQALLVQTNRLQEAQNALELKVYLIALGALLLVIISFFIYYYHKKRREDKLRAYNDNLDKYFRQKENEAKVKIAEKILDTVASGNLSSKHEARLIEVFNSENREEFQKDNLLLESNSNEDIQDAEIIEEKNLGKY